MQWITIARAFLTFKQPANFIQLFDNVWGKHPDDQGEGAAGNMEKKGVTKERIRSEWVTSESA